MKTHTMLGLLFWGTLFALATVSQAADPPLATKSFIYKKATQAELEMIVHYPPGWKETDKRPAIVFFFGGGWRNGMWNR